MASIPFRTPFNRPKTVPACAGSDLIADYHTSVDENGQTVLVKTERNLTDELQALSVQCDIEDIMSRSSLGDESALNQVKELQYGDTVGAPKNMIEAHAQIKRARLEFDSLPLQLRKLFNFNVEEYISEYGSEDFHTKLDSYLKPVVLNNVPAESIKLTDSTKPTEGGEN